MIERLFIVAALAAVAAVPASLIAYVLFSPPIEVGNLAGNIATIFLACVTWILIWLIAAESGPVNRAIADQGLARTEFHAVFLKTIAEYQNRYGWRGLSPHNAAAGIVALVEAILAVSVVLFVPDPFAGFLSFPEHYGFRVFVGMVLILPLLVLWLPWAYRAARLMEKRGVPYRELCRKLHEDLERAGQGGSI